MGRWVGGEWGKEEARKGAIQPHHKQPRPSGTRVVRVRTTSAVSPRYKCADGAVHEGENHEDTPLNKLYNLSDAISLLLYLHSTMLAIPVSVRWYRRRQELLLFVCAHGHVWYSYEYQVPECFAFFVRTCYSQ